MKGYNVVSEFWIGVVEIVLGRDFWIGVVETLLSLFSFAALIYLLEWRSTTRRLKKHVASYIKSVEFKWTNQTDEFALMYRVRVFELLLRRVQAMQPRTPSAYKRVEEVRDALEYFHRGGVQILNGEHLPLPKFDEFPIRPNREIEAQVRERILENLRAIKWLGLEKPPKVERAA